MIHSSVFVTDEVQLLVGHLWIYFSEISRYTGKHNDTWSNILILKAIIEAK